MHTRIPLLVGAGLFLPFIAQASDGIAGPGDSKFKFYGTIRADVTHDFKGSNADAGDWASFIQTQPIDGSLAARRHGDTYITARATTLGVDGELANGAVSFKVEADFNGTTAEGGRPGQLGANSMGFRVRHAYLQAGGWLVGQTWSNFSDGPSVVEMVQWNPPLTAAAPRQPQIRYTLGLGKGSELAFAAENAESFTGGTPNNIDKTVDLTARWSYMGDWGHVAAAFASNQYHVQDASSQRSARGYLAALTGSFKLGAPGRLVYGLFSGDGGGRYMWGSLLEGAVDTGTTISKFKSNACHAAYTHQWTPTLRSNIGYSAVTFQSNANAVANFHNKRVTQAFINVFAGVAPNTELGVELVDGRRTVMAPAVDATANPLGNTTGREQRLNVVVRTSF
jgi:hypothetical protein